MQPMPDICPLHAEDFRVPPAAVWPWPADPDEGCGDGPSVARLIRTGPLPPQAVRHVRPLAPEPADTAAVRDLVDRLLRSSHGDDLAGAAEEMARRLPLEYLLLRLFQPAARHLGELWLDDLCSFVDVTLAMAQLQRMLRHLTAAFGQRGRSPDGVRAIVLATLPGDQHTFGLSMTAEFFRRGGWTVRVVPDVAEALAGGDMPDPRTLVGFSVSRPDQFGDLAALIRNLRRTRGRRFAGILVGGAAFLAQPAQGAGLGADRIGFDARHALMQAEAMLAERRAGHADIM